MRPRLDPGRAWPPAGAAAPGSGRRRRRRDAACRAPVAPGSRPEETPITIEIVALIVGLGIAIAFAIGAILRARGAVAAAGAGRGAADAELRARQQALEQEAQQILVGAREEAFRIRGEAEADVRERRAEVARLELRTSQHEEALDRRVREVEQSEQRLTRREEELEELRQTTESERELIGRELERVAGLSQQEARAELLTEVEAEVDGEIAERI